MRGYESSRNWSAKKAGGQGIRRKTTAHGQVQAPFTAERWEAATRGSEAVSSYGVRRNPTNTGRTSVRKLVSRRWWACSRTVFLRADSRNWVVPVYGEVYIGFRCVLE